MKTYLATPWPDLEGSFDLVSHGRINVHQRTTWFGFQIHASAAPKHPVLLFALLEQSTRRDRSPVKFGVRVDLTNGEISDIANRTGVMGRLDRQIWPHRMEGAPLMMRWEVERTGQVLIPRLHIGAEEWLYPSLLFAGDSPFMAVTGHEGDARQAHDATFSAAYVWCQDKLGEG